MSDFMKTPCVQCPYRCDVKPFLHPERGEELAYAAQNPYNSFPCHKTTVDSDDDDYDGERREGPNTKMCAGFLSLMHNENGFTHYDSEGFEPSDLAYGDVYEMIDAYLGE
jgi:hypothetical protein